MKDYKLQPDDPRLTAYALGELEGEERAAIEAALRDDPVARAAVAEIRATSAQLEAALAAEALPAITPASSVAHAAITHGDDPRKLDGGPPRWSGKLVRFPQFYYVAGGLAAACFALFVTLREPKPATAHKAYREVALAPLAAPSRPAAVILVTAEVPKADPLVAVAPDIVVATAEVTAPAVAPAAATQTLDSEKLSLLAQAKGVEDQLNQTGALALGPQAGSAPIRASMGPGTTVAPVASAAGRMEIQPIADGKDGTNRVFTHPADEKLLREIQPTADEKMVKSPPTSTDRDSVVQAVPKPPTIVTSNPNLLNPSTGLILNRSTGAYTPSNQPGGTANPDGSRTFSATPPPPPATKPALGNETMLLSPFTLSSSIALVESAREALMRPLSTAQFGTNPAGAAAGQDNNFVSVSQNPVSAFPIDAGTSGYAAFRRFFEQKRLPPRDAVRIEELVNYFPYHYPPPRGDAPFAASFEVADAPWASEHLLVRVGLKAREVQTAPRPPMNIVFVLDVVDVERLKSRLPMMKEAILSLVEKLRPDDRVALVTCRDQGSLVLNPTPASKVRAIFDALDSVTAGGSTSRMRGIQYAYDLVQSSAAPGDSSRVILCTDGNAGITITAEGPLAQYLEGKKRSGVALTAFGFGMGIYRDPLIEFLADYGSGNYGYVDTRRDAEKMLAEDVNGASVTIAKDVKVEVEFNPARVASYRLIGYENRVLGKDDFKAGSLAADEISAGHAVTALFEIVPTDGRTRVASAATAERLRYQQPRIPAINLPAPDQNELLTVKVRYKKPGGAINRKLDLPVADSRTRFVDASADFKFAAAVAGFGMVLRDSPYKGTATLANIVEWAEAGTADDPGGYRGEFVELAREADRQVR